MIFRMIRIWLAVFVTGTVACKSEPSMTQGVAITQLAPGETVDTETSLSLLELQRRRAKVGEARVALGTIAAAAMEGVDDLGVCDFAPSGSIGPTPPVSVDCTKGPDRACVAVDPPSLPEHPWEYSSDLWQVGAWRYIGYRRYDDHHYRYSLEWNMVEGKYQPSCVVNVIVTGDLDGDGIESRFERSPGVNPWSAVNELE